MNEFNLKTQKLDGKDILTRAEMRNVTGGTVHICTANCDVESYEGHQTDYVTVPDCLHNPAAACTAIGGVFLSCTCH
jgi:hypothetical protein